jgi:hypothetical protein
VGRSKLSDQSARRQARAARRKQRCTTPLPACA